MFLEKTPRTSLLAEAGLALWVILLLNKLTKDKVKDILLYIASTTLREDIITIIVIKVG